MLVKELKKLISNLEDNKEVFIDFDGEIRDIEYIVNESRVVIAAEGGMGGYSKNVIYEKK